MMLTVIITAHNRKKFLIQALKSVISQTLPRDTYEIIVVKNFQEEEIDNVIRLNNVRSILMEGTVGQFLYEAIMHSSGDILSFLDDDDIFCDNKLEVVQNAFMNDQKLVYFKHSVQYMDPNGVLFNRIDSKANFNLSSISVRKDILYLQSVRKLLTSPDNFMFYNALDSGGKIELCETILSLYRRHESVTTSFSSFENFVNVNFQRLILDLKTTQCLINDFKMLTVKKLCYADHINSKIRLSIFQSIKGDRRNYINPKEILIQLQFTKYDSLKSFIYKLACIFELILPKSLKTFLEELHFKHELNKWKIF